MILYTCEGYRRSGVAIAMCHRCIGIPTYGLSGLRKGDELCSTGVRHFYLFTLYLKTFIIANIVLLSYYGHFLFYICEILTTYSKYKIKLNVLFEPTARRQ